MNNLKNLVYPHERTLGTISLILGIIVWLLLIAGTFGVALIVLAVGFIIYLFAQSALIAHIKGDGVHLSKNQFPDLYEQFSTCCDQLEIKQAPHAYILNGNGGLNAFATRFLGTQYVVLNSDVVDAMDEHEDGVRFYIGHELGHLRMKHLSNHFLRWPVLWLPLLGAAYSRARETSCDRHGLACSHSPEGAARALAALSAGSERWQTLDISAYLEQLNQTSGFWMSFHELISGYPWLSKRIARVIDPEAKMVKRNKLAYIPAMFLPYTGRLGAGFGFFALIYIVALLAAIALPAYQNFSLRAQTSAAIDNTRIVRDQLANYYEAGQQVPESLEVAGIDMLRAGDKVEWRLDPENMVFTVVLPQGEIIFVPSLNDQGQVFWNCGAGTGLTPQQLPPSCQDNIGE